MSTLNVANISDGTDTVETGYVVNGSAKVWASVDQRNTQTVSSSFNVSSITDTGVGLSALNLTSAMSGIYQVAFGSVILTSFINTSDALTAASPSTLAFAHRENAAGTDSVVTPAAHGDLA